MTDPSEPSQERPADPIPPRESVAAPKDPLRRSRTSGAWTAVIVAAVVLVLLVVFIVQNTQDVHISFLGWDGTVPLAVALLIAAVAGVVLTAVVGTLRIWQLRRRVRRDRTERTKDT
jgi:uncharacterized integral membrane protein